MEPSSYLRSPPFHYELTKERFFFPVQSRVRNLETILNYVWKLATEPISSDGSLIWSGAYSLIWNLSNTAQSCNLYKDLQLICKVTDSLTDTADTLCLRSQIVNKSLFPIEYVIAINNWTHRTCRSFNSVWLDRTHHLSVNYFWPTDALARWTHFRHIYEPERHLRPIDLTCMS